MEPSEVSGPELRMPLGDGQEGQMTILISDVDKFEGRATPPAIVEIFHGAIRDLVRKRLGESGANWADFVFDRSYELIGMEELSDIERRVVQGGYRYLPSATISAEERPGAYALNVDEGAADFAFEHPDAIVEVVAGAGKERRGQGDNVVSYPQNVSGIARYYRSIKDVMDGLTNGVPADTIAIIDDSGGTLTAPILEQFKGVICAGGTVKSHLGILTREYGIPCLMNARISGIRNGDFVEIEVSGPAKTMEAYARAEEMSVRVWLLSPA